MSDLVAFLIARLDEDEAAANEVHLARKCGCIDHDGEFSADPVYCSCEGPARVLREVEAKRTILTRYSLLLAEQEDQDAGLDGVGGLGVHGAVTALRPCVIALASVYSDHPDYPEAAAGTSLGEQPHDPEHCHHGGRPHLGPCIDGIEHG